MSEEKTLTQADIDAAVAKMQESIDKLESKNAELVADLRKARKTQEIKPEDLAAAEDRADKAEAALAAAQKEAKDAKVAAEKAAKALEAESGFTHRLLVENGLREALAANGVTNAVHQKAAMAMLASGVQVAADGDTRIAKVGDKALADYVKEWAGGDEGKHFVSAPVNSGGGAPGGTQAPAGAKTVTRAQFDAMQPVEKTTFAKEGGKVVEPV
jgi:hypothetical protein